MLKGPRLGLKGPRLMLVGFLFVFLFPGVFAVSSFEGVPFS